MGGIYSTHKKNQIFIHSFGRKLEGKRPPGRNKRRLENNTKTNLTDIGC